MKRDTATFRTMGEALFGPSWQTPLADALCVSLRNVQRWAAGKPVPDDKWVTLLTIAIERLRLIHSVTGDLRKMLRAANLTAAKK